MGWLRKIEERYRDRTPKSGRLFEKARRLLQGGVTHNVRYHHPYPLFCERGRGSMLVDVDGNSYVDYWCGHGAHLLGHNPPLIVEALKAQLERGLHYGTCHELEAALAGLVVGMVPSAEMVRFPNTGTEAAMYAVRLARGYTGRRKVGKFEGGWHGGFDGLYTAIKPPTVAHPSVGVEGGCLRGVVVLPFNDLEGVERVLRGEKLAGVIVEPVLGAGGCIPAEEEFLKGLRDLCHETGALLIFDEVITGFRLAQGGAQEYYEVVPDLTVLGKVIGGGLPIGGIAGPREIMARMDPLTQKEEELVYQGGTFCGNPLSMAAGVAMLKALRGGGVYDKINGLGDDARRRLRRVFEDHGVQAQVVGVGSLFSVHFAGEPIRDMRGAYRGDRGLLAAYHLHLMTEGVFTMPTHFSNISYAHSRGDIAKLLRATENFLEEGRGRGRGGAPGLSKGRPIDRSLLFSGKFGRG